MMDLVGAHKRVVDASHQCGNAIARIETLVGIDLPRGIGVARDLPATYIDRLQSGLHHLDSLAAGHRAERRYIGLGLHELP